MEMPKGPQDNSANEEQARKEVMGKLTDRQRRMVSKAESAISSSQKVEFGNRMGYLTENLKGLPDNWSGFNTAMESWKLSPDERSAVTTTIGLLQALKGVSNDHAGIVERNAYKLPVVATAMRVFNAHGMREFGWTEDATKQLVEAMAVISSPEAGADAAQKMGGLMTPEELEEAKKRVQNTKVT